MRDERNSLQEGNGGSDRHAYHRVVLGNGQADLPTLFGEPPRVNGGLRNPADANQSGVVSGERGVTKRHEDVRFLASYCDTSLGESMAD
jgi:hypothetical protein